MRAATSLKVLDGDAAVRAAVGTELGISDWYDITQQRIDEFVAATGDIHCTYFAVSLSNMFLPQIVEVRGFALGVNYGAQAVQVGGRLSAGDRVRATVSLTGVADVPAGIQTTMVIAIERHTSADDSQSCVIESLSRWMNPTAEADKDVAK